MLWRVGFILTYVCICFFSPWTNLFKESDYLDLFYHKIYMILLPFPCFFAFVFRLIATNVLLFRAEDSSWCLKRCTNHQDHPKALSCVLMDRLDYIFIFNLVWHCFCKWVVNSAHLVSMANIEILLGDFHWWICKITDLSVQSNFLPRHFFWSQNMLQYD